MPSVRRSCHCRTVDADEQSGSRLQSTPGAHPCLLERARRTDETFHFTTSVAPHRLLVVDSRYWHPEPAVCDDARLPSTVAVRECLRWRRGVPRAPSASAHLRGTAADEKQQRQQHAPHRVVTVATVEKRRQQRRPRRSRPPSHIQSRAFSECGASRGGAILVCSNMAETRLRHTPLLVVIDPTNAVRTR
jgi:hypothetical protein